MEKKSYHQLIARGTRSRSRTPLAKLTSGSTASNSWTRFGEGPKRRDRSSVEMQTLTSLQPSLTNTTNRISAGCLSATRALGRNRLAFIAITLTFAVSLILLTLTPEAHALNCYTCSSADNPACDESFSGRANITDTDCEKHIGRPAKVCRKIVQFIEDKKVIIRSCGWVDERADEKNEKKSMCYKRSGTFALMMESCVCYEDNCNHSASLVPNQSVLTLLTGSSIVYFYLARVWASSKRLV